MLPDCFVTRYVDEVDVDHGLRYESFVIPVHPPEPVCNGEDEHDWCTPHSVVGDNQDPTVVREVCANCGRYKIIDINSQNPKTGELVINVRYEDAGVDSIAWVAEISELRPGGPTLLFDILLEDRYRRTAHRSGEVAGRPQHASDARRLA